MTGRLAVLALGHRRLGDQGPEAGVVGGFVEVQELLVGDAQLFAELLQPLSDLAEASFDLSLRHLPSVGRCERVGSSGSDRSVRPGPPIACADARSIGRGLDLVQDGRRGADGWGIDHGYWTTDGQWRDTPDDTRAALRVAMGGDPGDEQAPAGPPVWTVPVGWDEPLLGPCRLRLEDGTDVGVVDALPSDLPIGRHRLAPVDEGPTTLLLVRPRGCHRPADLRLSALAVQAYAARSRRSWGIGDFRDLTELGSWAAAQGVDVLGLSPLHAPSPGDDPQPSPYYPSSRRHLNPLHLCIEDVPGARLDPRVAELGEQARALLDDRRIDRTAAWAAKREALERLFEARGTAIDRELAAFRVERGDDLERWATFCAISEVHPSTWQDWPEELQHPDSPAVARFANAHGDRVRFHAWLQWLADRQVAHLAEAIPLVTDLAVGVDPGGADAWIDQDLLSLDARVGAPPDDFALDGQDWGLPPYVPHRLRDDGYETFARTVRAALRHGAGIRIDHILGLFRLYWIPPEHDAASGAYVRMPADDLLAVLAIESVRAGAFVIGEDLGTVEEGVREKLGTLGRARHPPALVRGPAARRVAGERRRRGRPPTTCPPSPAPGREPTPNSARTPASTPPAPRSSPTASAT